VKSIVHRLFTLAGVLLCVGSLTVTSGGPAPSFGIFSSSQANAATSGGGPMVLDGMDPVCHSGYEGTGAYIAQVLKKTYDQVSNSNDGTIAILGANGANNSCGGNWQTLLSTQYLDSFTTAPTVNFYNTEAEVTSFFSSINTSTPAVIWIPDNWSRSSAVESVFTTNAEVIADFVNSGGGLFANMGSYGWLTALLPSATYNNGGCNGGPEATEDGASDFELTDPMVMACWHGFFTGNVGTLKTLVDYPYPSPTSDRVAVSIGGGEVSLPSSFTLSISPENPEAGQDLTVTATARTLDGVPQSGVTVTVTVSAGPDAGQTFTAVTDSSGVAIITIRTDSIGTAVYTATAVVNGVSKTVSTTVTWASPTAPPTTVPETAVPEPTVPQTAPPVVQIAEPVTETTVHDHSTHDHGPKIIKLPSTGIGFNFWLVSFGILFIAAGFFTRKLEKVRK
jgi:hypothetical protein